MCFTGNMKTIHLCPLRCAVFCQVCAGRRGYCFLLNWPKKSLRSLAVTSVKLCWCVRPAEFNSKSTRREISENEINHRCSISQHYTNEKSVIITNEASEWTYLTWSDASHTVEVICSQIDFLQVSILSRPGHLWNRLGSLPQRDR